MAAILLYLLKANAVLVLFAAAYYGLLRRLTFFGLNRAYLLLALLFAASYPALPVPALLPAGPLVALPAPLVAGPALASPGAASAPGFDWLALGLAGYALGTGLLGLRLLAQLLSLASVRRRARPVVVLGQPVRVLAGAGGPFSFGHTIYLSPATLADAAGLAAGLRHEQAHVRQWHTLDVLLVQVALALAWANPAAWLLRRAVLDNLEYLADRAALHTGLDRRAYQYSLLRQQPGWVPAPALAFQFSFLTLKNRITMLNQPASPTRQLGRYLLAAPLVMALALGYSGAHAQVAMSPSTQVKPLAAGQRLPADDVCFVDGVASTTAAAEALKPDLVLRFDVLNGAVARVFRNTSSGTANVIAVTTKANQAATAVQNLNTRMAQAEALVPKIEESELPAVAKAYIAHEYADYRLVVVNKILPSAKQNAVYQVNIAKGRRPYGFLLFDAAGNFLEKI